MPTYTPNHNIPKTTGSDTPTDALVSNHNNAMDIIDGLLNTQTEQLKPFRLGTVLPDETNVNTLTEAGTYFASVAGANAPYNGYWAYVVFTVGTTVIQVAFRPTTMRFRMQVSGTWNPWQIIYNA